MNKYLFILGIVLIPSMLCGQSGSQRSSSGKGAAKVKNYTLTGARHGINFFPKVELKSVQYVATDSLKFDKYHSADVIYDWLKRWAAKYPELIELYEVGTSFEGRPIYQITLTNKKT